MFKFKFRDDRKSNAAETHKNISNQPKEFRPSGVIHFIPEIVVINHSQIIKRAYHDITFAMAENDENLFPSDVTTGVYEGGLKTWECALDLANYLSLQNLNGKKCIELGSGSSIPGIYLQSKGLKVDYQDFNEVVIKYVTAPNVAANIRSSKNDNIDETLEGFEVDLGLAGDSKFYVGDWNQLHTLILKNHYEFVITSETIYNSETIVSLLNLMKHCLVPGLLFFKNRGFAFVAAKTNYFGLSGGVGELKKECETLGLEIECVSFNNDSVRREIYKIIFS
jgi:protein-histidine N-methyltransferase